MICKVNLPEVWEVVQLGDVVSAQYGKALTGKSRLNSGPYNVVGSSGIVGKHNQFLIETPCIVIGRKGSVGAVYLMSAPSWPIDTTYFFLLPDGLQIKYLYYLLGFLNLARLDKSTAIPGINRGDLYRTQIPLAPTGEQNRIVEKLEELFSDLDAGVTELKAAQKKLAQYRQSLLKAAVEGTLTAQWRAERVKSSEPLETGAQLLERILIERRRRWEEKQLAKFKEQGKPPPKDWRNKYPEPVKPKTADLPELPEGWVWGSVDQCAIDQDAITDGPFGSNLKSSHYTESGPRVIRLQNIGDGVFIDARAHISDEHYDLLKKHAVIENDVVVSMLGEILPRACIVPSNIAPAIVKADCARVRLNNGLLLPEYLNTCLNSQPTKERVGGLIKGIGRPRINLSHLRAICVPIPSLEEQHEIVRIILVGLEAMTQQIDAINLGLHQSAAQRQNILKAAFSGQLVPQDPNDEPASVLLERIRAERAARANESKQRSGHRKAKGA
jgi:type I restriction enzyme S subunit